MKTSQIYHLGHEVFLNGRLDAATAADAEALLLNMIDGGERHLLLDCSKLEFVSSMGIRSFLMAAKQMKSCGGNITLKNLRPAVKEVLKVTALLPLFQLSDSPADSSNPITPASPTASSGTEVREEFARELQTVIRDIHRRHRADNAGEVATYIPELGKANPEHFGVCAVTAEGRVFAAGDCDESFTIQSISKPFIFAMAVEAHGFDKVSRHVGLEPSGDAFNAIEFQPGTNRPYNPMVNAGAITTTALLHVLHGEKTFDLILNRLSAAAGRPLKLDESVYESERRTGHRNRAISHLLLNCGLVHEQMEAALDVYFRQCSILLSCRDLAMIGATVANLGRQPVSGIQVFDPVVVRHIMSIMFTCGMYDYSGEWAFRVGLPAKSGVSGGLMAVVNRQVGIATYSPRLDARGNSVRGIEACVDLAGQFGLHAFDPLNVGSNFLKVLA